MTDECSVAKPVELKPCLVVRSEDWTKDGDTTTAKTTWTCSVHTPPDECVIEVLNQARDRALEDAAKALEGGSFLHKMAPDAVVAKAGAAVIRKLKSK